ncbi:NAD(P)-dependent oxidoreductase [Streptomonospora salina]|uniref:3-hydroxyisobutyrate dehydrogenase-like beta-hydroxyacid dehydrogenase n=1 Tax=Streptomonospora salina TaxID=104205 RepID=A0A841E8C6_9ACTN|nr:NAD(P)-dependent oxidoreductase [Streptomonospora salina]MBB5998734.1 3-hydroxyisobutyrate dehydrogenase-like beta-hydroxyacid dehydrogenase [Streptomonospora salina]
MRSRVGLLHPGQMGAAIATRLDTEVLWCPDGRSAGTRERADQAGLHSASITDLAECDVILSVVDPAAAEDVAAALMTAGFRDGLYIDANAIRPDRAQTLADDVGKVGADMIDACIVGPPPRDGARTRMFLSGPPDSRHRAAELLGTAVEITELDDVPGRASALKLSHTVAQKATRTLGALAHAMATQHGVDDHLTSLAAAAPHPAANPEQLPGVAARAWRWHPELDDTARALTDAGLPGEALDDIADILRLWTPLKDDPTADLDTVLGLLSAGPPPPEGDA